MKDLLVIDHRSADIIGDVHGCFQELYELLTKLGYDIEEDERKKYGFYITNPPGRVAVFVGDICDRGPAIIRSLKLVMTMVESGQAYLVLGNHDAKLLKKLNGRNVVINHGLDETLAALANESETFVEEVRRFLERLPIQLVLDDGQLIVAHAGLPEKYHYQSGPQITRFALYGDITGTRDEYGLPIRHDWTVHYRGKAIVVYGHVPQKKPYISNNTYGIDTGCVFGGYLTALRYPELEIVQVKAKQAYSSHAYLSFS